MQVPERLALIGGSILLSSTLIFTLKSQASSIIPSVGYSISHVFDHIGDAQKSSDFNGNYQEAQQGGRKTGTWGTAKWYIDKDDNLHIGSGQLQGRLYEAIGMDTMHSIHSINIDQNAQAPQDSNYLFSPVEDRMQNPTSNITSINGLNNLDVSNTNNMFAMFANNAGINSLDLSSWNTSKATSFDLMFNQDTSLQDLNMNNWNTQNVQGMTWMFFNIPATKLNLSSFDTKNVHDMGFMYNGANNLREITLGPNTKNTPLSGTSLINGTWKNGSQSLNSYDFQGNASIPGTWIRQ